MRRWLSFDPAGYNIEVVPRSAPPGLTEVTWRNPTPVLGHKEIIRANIQGAKVTRLSRQFDAPQSVKEASPSLIRLTMRCREQGIILHAHVDPPVGE